jgi:hypothetical protein
MQSNVVELGYVGVGKNESAVTRASPKKLKNNERVGEVRLIESSFSVLLALLFASTIIEKTALEKLLFLEEHIGIEFL